MEDKLQEIEKRLSNLERVIGGNLTQEQARKLLNISRTTMIRYRKDGIVPYHLQNGRPRYRYADICKLL